MLLPLERTIGELTFTFIRPPDRKYTFQSQLLLADENSIVLAHEASPSRPLVYANEEVIARGFGAVWFLSKDRPFDIGRFYRPDGRWTGYYVDILEPVRWTGSDPLTLQPIVDLFLDVWIAPDGSYVVLDEDEFEDAIRAGRLSDVQAQHARTTLVDVRRAIEEGTFLPPLVTEFVL